MLGREVQVLIDGTLGAGTHQSTFNATDLPSGLYTYRLDAGSFTQTKLMMLVN